MDPISFVVSVIAIVQARDRLIQLASKIRLSFNALEEIDALTDDLSDLRLVLDTVHMTASNLPEGYVTGLEKALESCNQIVLELEEILTNFLSKSQKANGSVHTQIHRIRWVKKKNRVESLRYRLRDAKSTLMLQLLSINPAILCQDIITKGAVSETRDIFRDPIRDKIYPVKSIDKYCGKLVVDSSAVGYSESLGHVHHQMEGAPPDGDNKDFPSSPFQLPKTSLQGCLAAMPSDSLSQAPLLPEPPQCESIIQARDIPYRLTDSISIPSAGLRQLQITKVIGSAATNLRGIFCVEACQCSCHGRLSRQLHLFNGRLGSVLISCTGQPFKPEECNQRSCIRRCTPRLLLVFYIRLWFTMAVVSLAFSNAGRPHIALSFPSVMPPESEFFACIRTGQCEQIKQLLQYGKASVADIAAPYGLTPLGLAIIYDQKDTCRLLIQAGAQLLAPKYTYHRSDVWNYIAHHSLLNSSISTGTLIQDLVRLYSPELQMKAMLSCIQEPGFENDDYSRLHKCVLGLTSESVDIIGRISRISIDETDSIGRTALYWGAYIGDERTIDVLLRCGANPNVIDHNGMTPLHAAAGRGSLPCINALINGGAVLELRDRFGATPLHYASAHGHMGVVEFLLNEGADCEAENYFGETPVTYAIFGKRPSVIRHFLHRTAAIEHVDKWGYTPLLDAIFVDSHEILELLLQLDSTNIWVKLIDDKTLLHVAASNADLKTIEILQNARLCGPNTAAVDAAGYTALDYVRQRKDVAEIIEPFGALLLSVEVRSSDKEEENVVPRSLLSSKGDKPSLAEVYSDALEY